MSGRKIGEKILSIPEVKKIMEDVKEKINIIDPEEGMSHFQEITYNYVTQFSKMDIKKSNKLKRFLQEEIGLEEVYAVNIINIVPGDIHELKVILEKSNVGKTMDDEALADLLAKIQELLSS